MTVWRGARASKREFGAAWADSSKAGVAAGPRGERVARWPRSYAARLAAAAATVTSMSACVWAALTKPAS